MSGEKDAAGAQAPAVRVPDDPASRADPPLYEVALWPHRSMTRSGFRWFIGALAAGLAIPLAVSGWTPVGFFLAPFLIGALALVWGMVRLNDRRRARLSERLRLWADSMLVEHRTEAGALLRWSAHPYWVAVDLRTARGVENYLTLKGGGRVIELGSFLTPEERALLAADLRAALKAVAEGRRPDPPATPRIGDAP